MRIDASRRSILEGKIRAESSGLEHAQRRDVCVTNVNEQTLQLADESRFERSNPIVNPEGRAGRRKGRFARVRNGPRDPRECRSIGSARGAGCSCKARGRTTIVMAFHLAQRERDPLTICELYTRNADCQPRS